MDIERKCLTCHWCAEDTTPQAQIPIVGQRRFMCLFGPIAASAFPVQNGGVLSIASYPSINDQTVSCGRYLPQPSGDVAAIIKKGTNDGTAR